jgi:hypothetical protein
MKFNWTILFEACKEPLRLLVLAVIPVLIAQIGNLDFTWAIYATIILRFIDKYLYELGKANKNETLTRGLTQF